MSLVFECTSCRCVVCTWKNPLCPPTVRIDVGLMLCIVLGRCFLYVLLLVCLCIQVVVCYCYYLNVIFCVTMLECIRKYIRDRFISKKQERWTHPLGHLTWTIYLENKQKSSSCNAAFNERYLFEVTYNTNGTVFVDL